MRVASSGRPPTRRATLRFFGACRKSCATRLLRSTVEKCKARTMLKSPGYAAVFLFAADPAIAACEGPDSGEAATVVTVPANESVDVFQYSDAARASVI